ncbi:MAG: hypothetical protein HYX83_03430 [Chloroflexi bacterium]|nr:hypothetical protein [Chloroflexota bacterium]
MARGFPRRLLMVLLLAVAIGLGALACVGKEMNSSSQELQAFIHEAGKVKTALDQQDISAIIRLEKDLAAANSRLESMFEKGVRRLTAVAAQGTPVVGDAPNLVEEALVAYDESLDTRILLMQSIISWAQGDGSARQVALDYVAQAIQTSESASRALAQAIASVKDIKAPPFLVVSVLSAPAAKPGEPATVTAQVVNYGDAPAANVEVRIETADERLRILEAPSRVLGTLQPQEEHTLDWTAALGGSDGAVFTVMATMSGVIADMATDIVLLAP